MSFQDNKATRLSASVQDRNVSGFSQESRKAFYRALFSAVPDRPEVDFQRICEAWLNASGAEWVWLWLFNPYTNEWEIHRVSSRNGNDIDFTLPSRVLPAPDVPKLHSAAAYCLKYNEPLLDVPVTWTAEEGELTYGVVSRKFLMDTGCTRFDCIPFSEPAPKQPLRYRDDPNLSVLSGAICLHYVEGSNRTPQPRESIELMSGITAMAVVNSFAASQFELLVDLNSLAEEFLAKRTKPVTSRREYLRSVIDLIRDRLHIAAASVFYHDHYQRSVKCVASTGLCGQDKQLVQGDALDAVTYKAGEGRTGRCFEYGATDVFTASEAQAHHWKYSEMVDGKQVGKTGAALIPIPLPNERDAQDSQSRPGNVAAHGVLRCSDRILGDDKKLPRPFDPITVQTLEFVARQIGPVLETLHVRVERERTISIIKHDLYAPLAMIRDTAAEIDESLHKGSSVGKHDLMNLQTAAMVADCLIGELDIDPGETELEISGPVKLEGDIVARVRNMLRFLADRDNNMSIKFDGFRAIHPLYVDRRMVERVIVNLLINAIKYGAEGTPIVVHAYENRAKQCYCVDVRNQGIGIPREDQEHIFEPNFRSSEAREIRQGAGLGLHIAKRLMEAHGGDLLLSKGDPLDTEFTAEFPNYLRFRGPDQ